MFAPIYEKDGNELFLPIEGFFADDEETARRIGWGSMLVECVLMRMNYTGKILSFDPHNQPHVAAKVGGTPVAIIAGPLFESECQMSDADETSKP